MDSAEPEALHFTCDLIIADQPTLNGRVYSTACLEKMVSDIQVAIKDRRMLVYPESAQLGRPYLQDARGVVTSVTLVDGRLRIDIIPLPGKQMFEGSIVFPVAAGKTDSDNNVYDSEIVGFCVSAVPPPIGFSCSGKARTDG